MFFHLGCAFCYHYKAVESGEGSIIALTDYAVESTLGFVGGIIYQLDREAVKCIEMIACNNSTAVKVPEMFYAAHLFYDQLIFLNKTVNLLAG